MIQNLISVSITFYLADALVPIVIKTWARDFLNVVKFYSDKDDPSIPTINIGVENTDSGFYTRFILLCFCLSFFKFYLIGHCAKTIGILKVYAREEFQQSWIVIVDDDTLLRYINLNLNEFHYI